MENTEGLVNQCDPAGELARELKILEYLNDEIDQLASEARACDILEPRIARCLDLAWYFAELAMREAGSSSCGHLEPSRLTGCQCCIHFLDVRQSNQSILGRL